MNYDEALAYIHSLSQFGSKPGLDRVSRLVSLANNPQKALKFIHIAGTSGKGSTATYCANILKCAGYKVGLYTSPYVIDFRERFRINGEVIPKDEFCSLCKRLIPLVEKLNNEGDIITEFEFNTVLALVWFYEQKCDVVCLEVGMGGRFDATNIIPPPLVSVITRIGLDHTAYLGNTVSEIAFEKCGIIKNGSRVVSYPNQKAEALETITRISNERGCELFVPSLSELSDIKLSLTGSDFVLNGLKIHLNMAGEHQIHNFLTAYHCVLKSGFDVNSDAIIKGAEITRSEARLEVISNDPCIIIDGAHNADKILALYEFIKGYKGKIVAVCGMLRDKDFEVATRLIAPLCKKIVTVTPDNPRALSSEEFAEVCSKYCDDVIAERSVKRGALTAFDLLSDGDIMLSWGSLYIAGEIREVILEKLKTKS